MAPPDTRKSLSTISPLITPEDDPDPERDFKKVPNTAGICAVCKRWIHVKQAAICKCGLAVHSDCDTDINGEQRYPCERCHEPLRITQTARVNLVNSDRFYDPGRSKSHELHEMRSVIYKLENKLHQAAADTLMPRQKTHHAEKVVSRYAAVEMYDILRNPTQTVTKNALKKFVELCDEEDIESCLAYAGKKALNMAKRMNIAPN